MKTDRWYYEVDWNGFKAKAYVNQAAESLTLSAYIRDLCVIGAKPEDIRITLKSE